MRPAALPIPFRDLSEDEPSGVAGFLRFIDETDGAGMRGALFIMSSRGEPIEFAFTRIDVRSSVLWRPGQARTRAVSALAKALFESVSSQADVLLALLPETPAEVFSGGILPEASLCLVDPEGSEEATPWDVAQRLSESLTLYWANGLPPPGSLTANTVELLGRRRLLIEPFERAAMGIREAFDS